MTERNQIRYTVDDGVGWAILTNPPANTYFMEMFEELRDVIRQVRRDPETQVLVITGDGEKFFCGGANIKRFGQATKEEKFNFCAESNVTLNELEETGKPVIAAFNGIATGGGLEIGLACDLRLAWRDHGKVGLPEVNLGLLPGDGGCLRLPLYVGMGRALDMVMNGKLLTFEEAEKIGLITSIFDASSLTDFHALVQGYARNFCAPQKASRAIGFAKRAVRAAFMEERAARLLVGELQQRLFEGHDATEGVTAFLEKRPAVFEGE